MQLMRVLVRLAEILVCGNRSEQGPLCGHPNSFPCAHTVESDSSPDDAKQIGKIGESKVQGAGKEVSAFECCVKQGDQRLPDAKGDIPFQPGL